MPRKPSKKKVTAALDKYLPDNQKFNKPKKPRKKKIKLVELDQLTFGPLIADKGNMAGFVYMVTIITNMGVRYYIGSKQFDAEWERYCTSSEIVQRLIATSRVLPEAVKIKYEVLELIPTKSMLKIRENVRIRGMYALVGKQRCINIRDPFGVSLRTGKRIA